MIDLFEALLITPVADLGNDAEATYRQWGKHHSSIPKNEYKLYDQDAAWMPAETYSQNDDKIEFHWGQKKSSGISPRQPLCKLYCDHADFFNIILCRVALWQVHPL